jgi:hypothetical protein
MDNVTQQIVNMARNFTHVLRDARRESRSADGAYPRRD